METPTAAPHQAEAPATSERPPRLPLQRAVEALDDWLLDRRGDALAELSAALGSLIAVRGATSGRLRLDCSPLPRVEVPLGNVEVPLGNAAHWGDVAAADVQRFELRGDRGRVVLGEAVLVGDDAARREAAHLLELACDLAWSRAEARQAGERLEALDAATVAIAAELSLERVLQVIVDRVRPLAGARYAALGIVGERGQIERFITSGVDEETRRAIGHPPRGHGLLGLIVRDGRSVLIPDIAADPRRSSFPPHHPPMTSLLGVPVLVEGSPIGNLYLTDRIDETEFSEADLRLVEGFARHAGIAIHNARLHEELQHLAVLQERERIGQDLHDGIIQALYAVGLTLEDVTELMATDPQGASQRVERAIDSIHASIRDIRNFIFGLRPELLEEADLGAGLAALADEFRRSTLVDVDLDTDPAAELDPEGSLQVLQLAREALSNVARHAAATLVAVQLRGGDGVLELVIADNGRGFDPTEGRGPGHHGLTNMRARAESLGGTLTLDSHPGAGTRVVFQLEMPAPPTEETTG